MTTNERDAMLKLALSPADELRAPADLGDSIYREIVATPQRRPLPVIGRLARQLPASVPVLVGIGLLLLLAIVLAIAALLRTPKPAILAMYHGGPDRTGVMPGPAPDGQPVRLWDVALPGALPFNTMPLPFEDEVLVADQSGQIAALDSASGRERWTHDVGATITGAPALVQLTGSGSTLMLVGTATGDVVAVNAGDGTPAWHTTLGGVISASLLVADGVAYAGVETGDIDALDPATGRVLWSVKVDAAITRGAAIGDGVLYVGTAGGWFSAIDLESHVARWSVRLGEGEVGTPTVGNGRVYVGAGLKANTGPHDLLALDARDGSIDWFFASPSGKQVHMGGLADGQVIAVSEDFNVYGLDADTGAVRWTAKTQGRVVTLAAIVGDLVFVSSEDRNVRALDARTGAELWMVPTKGSPTMPAILDGRLYIGTDLGQVLALGGSGPPATGR